MLTHDDGQKINCNRLPKFKKKNGAHTFHLRQPHSFTLKLQIYNRNEKILALLNLQSVLFHTTKPKKSKYII